MKDPQIVIVLSVCFLIAWASSTMAAPTLVQQKASASPGYVSGGQSVTLDASPTAGNSLIAIVTHNSSRTISSVTGGGVTWTQSVHPSVSPFGLDIWYGHNSSGSGTLITATPNTGLSSNVGLEVTEWSGLANAAPEATNSNSGTSSTPTTLSVTPTSASSLVIAGMVGAGLYSSGPINSFNRLTGNTNGSNETTECDYQIESSSAAYATGNTWNGSVAWTAAIAAFGSSGGGPLVKPLTMLKVG